MKLPGIGGFYEAHSSNFTKGREGNTPQKFVVHHTAAFESTLRLLWQNPARNGSSHLFIGQGYYEQYVSLLDTAWTNGNWQSNLRSITAEVRGDWRGYRDQATLDSLTEAMYQSLKLFPDLTLSYHMDESTKTTLCPADLKHKGYALECWNKAKNRIAVEAKAATSPATLRIDIPDKKVKIIRDTNLWDMSFTSFAGARAIKALPAGTIIDVAGIYDHPLSKSDYYLSNYSWNAGKNWGINQADCEDYIEPKPTPPPTSVFAPIPAPNTLPAPKPPLPEPPTEGAGTLPPIPVDLNGDKLNEILVIVRWIKNLLAKIFKGE